MRIGILTGGGDCPGLNPAIRGAVMRGLDHGFEFIGLELGWKGLVEGITTPLNLERVEEIISRGGTILGSSRTNPFRKGSEEELEKCLATFKRLELDALVALGGEDTLGVANKFYKHHGLHMVGVPKTMDNDLNNTDYTFGFDTAAGVGLDAADRLLDTARSHRRILVLEVMGRHAGWVALHVGIASGADWICLPEFEVNLDQMADALRKKRERGKLFGLVVTSEGAELPSSGNEAQSVDAFGHVTLKERRVGEALAQEIERRVGVETRAAVLGHVQRGGSPTLFDRVLGTRVGIKAADMVKNGEWGKMAALKGTEVVAVDLDYAVNNLKTVPHELWEETVSLINK
jgi:phosphofructokinase-like protein